MNDDCIYGGLPVRLTDSCISHLFKENIDPLTLCDMLQNDIDCPEKTKKLKKFKKSSLEICSERKGKIYRILLEKDYTIDIRNYAYLVTHLKPI